MNKFFLNFPFTSVAINSMYFKSYVQKSKNVLRTENSASLLTPACFQELADRLPDAHSARFLFRAGGRTGQAGRGRSRMSVRPCRPCW